MTADDDRDLEGAFAALGRHGREGAPAFRQLTSREALTAVRWRRQQRRVATLVIAIAIPTFLILRGRSERVVDYERFTALTGIDLGEVTWEAPSDVLLNIPGRDLLRRVPIIDVQWPAIVPDSNRLLDSSNSQRRSRS